MSGGGDVWPARAAFSFMRSVRCPHARRGARTCTISVRCASRSRLSCAVVCSCVRGCDGPWVAEVVASCVVLATAGILLLLPVLVPVSRAELACVALTVIAQPLKP
eukprot:1146532-Prymnesium_polylepis.1